MLTTRPTRVIAARYAQLIDSAMSARSAGLCSTALTRRLRCASTGMATTAMALTAMPASEDSGSIRKSKPAIETRETYTHSRTSKTAEIRVAAVSPDRPVNSRNKTIPLRSSTIESMPKAVSRTLRATIPAPTATHASISIQAMVSISSRMPRPSALARAASMLELSVRIAGNMGPRVAGYRNELRGLKDWEPYLRKHSRLPGPRANLELVAAVAEEADADRLWRVLAPPPPVFPPPRAPPPGAPPPPRAPPGGQMAARAAS